MIAALILSLIAASLAQKIEIPQNGTALTFSNNDKNLTLFLVKPVDFSAEILITVTSGEIEAYSGPAYSVATHTIVTSTKPTTFRDILCGSGDFDINIQLNKGPASFSVKSVMSVSKYVSIGDTVTSSAKEKDSFAYHLLRVPSNCTDFTILVESNNLSVSAFIPQGSCGTSSTKPIDKCNYGIHPTVAGVLDYYYVEYRCAYAGTYSMELYSSDNKTLDYKISISAGIKNCDQLNRCSGYNGRCVNGKCRCSEPFMGEKCDQIDSAIATQLVSGSNSLKFKQHLHAPYSAAYAFMYAKDTLGKKNVVVTQSDGFLLNAYSENYESLVATTGYASKSIEVPNYYASGLMLYQVFYRGNTNGNATSLQVELVDRTLTAPSTVSGTFPASGPFYRAFRLAAPVSSDLRVVYEGSKLNGLFIVKDKNTIFADENVLATPNTTNDYMGVSAKGIVDCATCDYYLYVVGSNSTTFNISAYLSTAACKGGCGDHGFCVRDSCRCDEGFSGANCETAPTDIAINKLVSIPASGTWFTFTIPSGSVFNILGLKNFADAYFYKSGNSQNVWRTDSPVCDDGIFMIKLSSGSAQSIYINAPAPSDSMPAAINFASMAATSSPSAETFHYLIELPWVPANAKVTVTLNFDAYESPSPFFASFGHASTCADTDADYDTSGTAAASGGSFTLTLAECHPGDYNFYLRVEGARNVRISKSVDTVSTGCSLAQSGAINSAYCGTYASGTVLDTLISTSCPLNNHVRAADEFIQFYTDSYIDTPYYPAYASGYADYFCYSKYASTKSTGQIIQQCPNQCYSFLASGFSVGQVKSRFTCNANLISSSNTAPSSCSSYPPRYAISAAPSMTSTTGKTPSDKVPTGELSSAFFVVANFALIALVSIIAF